MAMAWIWTGMVALSVLYGATTGNIGAVGSAALAGASAAVELCLGMAGAMCLWSGIMAVMDACGLTQRLQAARRMADGTGGRASDELCRLVVLNTASIQLLPTTVAGVRAALGAENPFDILPAVWLASVLSVSVGLLAAQLLGKFWRD